MLKDFNISVLHSKVKCGTPLVFCRSLMIDIPLTEAISLLETICKALELPQNAQTQKPTSTFQSVTYILLKIKRIVH